MSQVKEEINKQTNIPWICSFISDRQQCVRYIQELSDFKTLKGGLPQGTKMGPLGFQVIINDAASDAKVSVWKYVYDLTLADNATAGSNGNTQVDLDNFVNWSKVNNLTLNPSKCQGLQICFMKEVPTPSITIDDVPLNFVKSAKILCIWIQDDLKWSKQVHEMLKKVNKRLYMLRTLKRFGFNADELAVTYKGYVRPLVDYGDVVWDSSLTQDQVTSIERVQKRACKIILGKEYNSYNDALSQCDIETLSERRQNHSLKFAKSLSTCAQTESLIPPTRFQCHGKNLRSANSTSQLYCRTERFKNSPIPHFIDLMNSQ